MTSRNGELDGKVAIVTGAGRGLGRAEALNLAREGARVVINDLGGNPDAEAAAMSVVEEIKGFGGEAFAFFGDCADWNDSEQLFKKALDTWGDVNILVNNAGFCRDRLIFNMTEDEFDTVVRVHLKGHFVNMRHATKYWREKCKADGAPVYGRLVSTSSEAFLFGSAGQPNYAAAKAGIVAMTMGAAQVMYNYGVTANVICPRARTDMTNQGVTASMFAKPESGFDTFAPENVSPLVTYLASPEAGNVSGQVFVVWGKQVVVVDSPKEAAQFNSPEAWTQESLNKSLGEYFANKVPVRDGFISFHFDSENWVAVAVPGGRDGKNNNKKSWFLAKRANGSFSITTQVCYGCSHCCFNRHAGCVCAFFSAN